MLKITGNRKDFIRKLKTITPIKSKIVNFITIRISQTAFSVEATNHEQFVKLSIPIINTKTLSLNFPSQILGFTIEEGAIETNFCLNIDLNLMISALKSSNNPFFNLSCNEFDIIIDDIKIFEVAGGHDNIQIPVVDKPTHITLPKSALVRLIKESIFAVSKDDARESLCGVLLEIDKTKLSMVGCDGHRLGYSVYENDTSLSLDAGAQILIPFFALNFIFNKIHLMDNIINIKFNSSFIIFENEGFVITSKLIDAGYPNYRKVVPTKFSSKAIINKKALLEQLTNMCTYSSSKNYLTKFIFTPTKLELTNSNNFHRCINIKYTHTESFTISFNAFFMKQILSLTDMDYIQLNMQEKNICACTITSLDPNVKSLFLLMPLRLFEE